MIIQPAAGEAFIARAATALERSGVLGEIDASLAFASAAQRSRALRGCVGVAAEGVAAIGELPAAAQDVAAQLVAQARAGTYALHDAGPRYAIARTLADAPGIGEASLGEYVGFNGQARVAALRGGAHQPPLLAVTKTASQQAASELFGARVLDALGIGHLGPVVAARRDGSVAVQLLAGSEATAASVHDDGALVSLLARHYAQEHGLAPAEAAIRGRVDVDLLKVADFITANGDRAARNLLVDEQQALPGAIDFGYVGWGEINRGGTISQPALLREFQGGDRVANPALRRVELHPVTRELLGRVDRDEIRAAHAELVAATDGAGRAYDSRLARTYAQVTRPWFAEDVIARLDQAATGSYEYTEVRPLAQAAMPPLVSGGRRF